MQHVHKAVGIFKDHKKPIADFLVKKIAKPTKDAATEGAVSSVFMVFCFHLAGFPKGSISCVAGKGSEIGSFLTMHPRVNCIRVE